MKRLRGLALLALVAIGAPAFAVACGKTKSTKLSPQECDALRTGAAASAEKASHDATFLTSDHACHSHADCVEVPRPSCVMNCNGYAAPKAARDSVATSLRAIEEGACKKWKDEGCETIAPMPVASCAVYAPACKGNSCIMRDPREVLSAAECQAILAESSKELAAKLAAADRSCKKDDDCTLTNGGCVGSCGGPAIAKTGETAYKAEYASIGAKCKKWWDGECMTTTPVPIASCAPIYARCKGGLCTSTP